MIIEKRWFGYIVLLFVIVLLKSCISTHSEENNLLGESNLSASEQVLIDEITNTIEEQFQLKNAPTGMAAAIVKDGKILMKKGFGWKEAGGKDSIDEHTVFRIASLSKGFAAVLASQIVMEKKLNWTSKVKDYIPNFQLNNDSATQVLNMKHLLSQSTGLPRHTYGNLIEAGQSMEEMIPRLKEVPLVAAPGQVMSYQNLAYSLVQPMLEKATKLRYDSLLKQYIYKPLKMFNASTDYESLMLENNIALPHSSRNSRPMEQQDDYFSVLPSAGVNASISDMAIWVNALLGHHPEVITLESLRPIYKQNNLLPKNNPWSRKWENVISVGYAMGWRTINYKGQKLIYHGGYLNGYRAEMAFCLEEDFGIVVLSNSFSRFLMRSVPIFFDIYNQKKNEKDSM